MASYRQFAFILLLLLLHSRPAQAALFKGSINSDRGFAFLASFCFDYDPDPRDPAGTFVLSVQDPSLSSTLKWAIYDDESVSWPVVLEHESDWNCQQLSAFDPDTRSGPAFGTGSLNRQDNGWTSTGVVPVYQRLRPRFWFLALVNCVNAVPQPMNDIKFEVHFMNSQENAWSIEFGSNERGLNTLYLVFLIAYVLLISLQAYGTYRLKQELGFVHPIVKLFTAAVVVEGSSVTFYAGHYLAFTSDGVGAPLLLSFAGTLAALSRLLFILILFLLAHGWTISRDTFASRRTIALVLGTFFTLQVAITAYEWASYDPKQTSITFVNSVLQFSIIACYLCFAAYFMVVIFFVSYREESAAAKKILYARLGSIYSVWLFGTPLVAIFVLLLDDWVRLKITQSVALALTAAAYFLMCFLLWPSRAQEYFRIFVDPVHGVELSDFGEQLTVDTDSASEQRYRPM